MFEAAFDSIGVLGEAMLFLVFLMLQRGWLCATGIGYLCTNFLGSMLVLTSFFPELHTIPSPWNWGFLLVHSGWLMVSGLGLFHIIKNNHLQKPRIAANEPATHHEDKRSWSVTTCAIPPE